MRIPFRTILAPWLVVSLLAAGQGCGGRLETPLPMQDVPASMSDAGADAPSDSCAPQGIVQLAEGADSVTGPFPSGATALDDSNFYWIVFTGDTQSILSVPKCGGVVSTFASGLSPSGHQGGIELPIAADGANVYWTTPGTFDADSGLGAPPNPMTGTVMRAPANGGAFVTLAEGQNDPTSIAVDDTNVFWTNLVSDGGRRAVMTMPKEGGSITTLAPNLFGLSLAANDTSVSWLSCPARYCGNPGSGPDAVMSVPKGGGTIVTIASGPVLGLLGGAGYRGLSVDSTNAYWPELEADGLAAFLVSAPLVGGVPKALASIGVPPTNGTVPQTVMACFAVDDTSVYWAELDGAVMRVPKGGGTPVTLVPGGSENASPMGMAVDPTSVFWVDNIGNVWKAPN